MASESRISTWGEEISLEYGKALRGYSSEGGRYRVYGSNGPIGWHPEFLAQGPGVILGRKGAYRGVEYCPDPFFVIDTAYYVVPKSRDLDMRWLYYAIKHHKLGEIDDGSPIPSTTRSAVYVRELEIPPLPEQKAIARVLGTLDDKIELNRRMNATLEAMARALFQSWFVDFDPVQANAAGRPPSGLETASLFPASLQSSVLGEIPTGWRVGSIYEAADIIYGAPFSSKQFNEDGDGKPLIRIRDLADESPGVCTPEVHPKGYMVQPGDVVVGMDGEFRAYLWGGVPAWLNQRVCVFSPKPTYSAAFVRNSVIAPLAHVEATETATTVIHLGKNDIDRFKVVIPPPDVRAAFAKLCQPWYDRIVANKQQARTLATLRDTLLPKLLSGALSAEIVAANS